MTTQGHPEMDCSPTYRPQGKTKKLVPLKSNCGWSDICIQNVTVHCSHQTNPLCLATRPKPECKLQQLALVTELHDLDIHGLFSASTVINRVKASVNNLFTGVFSVSFVWLSIHHESISRLLCVFNSQCWWPTEYLKYLWRFPLEHYTGLKRV